MTGVTEGTGVRGELKRNVYKDGQVLSAAALRRESEYFLARDRQHAVLAHTPGILSGLELEAEEEEFYVSRGAAIDAYGRLILVPVKEQITVSLATTPVLLQRGDYFVELLYDRRASGRNGNDPCAEGGDAAVRDSYRLRLRLRVETVPKVGTEAQLDIPPDDPNTEAPVVLGTIHWNKSSRTYESPSSSDRVYAGVVGDHVTAASRTAALVLHDKDGKVAVRVAPTDAPAESPSLEPLHDGLTIDGRGSVWVKGGVDVGAGGLTLRTDETKGPWGISLYDDAKGVSFDPVAADSEAPGELELRIAFSGEGDPTGKRRVVIGTGVGKSFKPTLVVYDGGETLDRTVVEVKGDLYVRGIAKFSEVAPISTGQDLKINDILSKLFGPLGEVVHTWLLRDREWLGTVFEAASHEFSADFKNDVIDALLEPKVDHEDFIESVAGRVAQDLLKRLLEEEPPFATLLEQFETALAPEAVTQKLAEDLDTAPATAPRIARLCDALHKQCPPKFKGQPSE